MGKIGFFIGEFKENTKNPLLFSVQKTALFVFKIVRNSTGYPFRKHAVAENYDEINAVRTIITYIFHGHH